MDELVLQVATNTGFACLHNVTNCLTAVNDPALAEFHTYIGATHFIAEKHPTAHLVEGGFRTLSYALLALVLQVLLNCHSAASVNQTHTQCPSIQKVWGTGVQLAYGLRDFAAREFQTYSIHTDDPVGGALSVLVRQTFNWDAEVLQQYLEPNSAQFLNQVHANQMTDTYNSLIDVLIEAARRTTERRRRLTWEIDNAAWLKTLHAQGCKPGPLVRLVDNFGMRYDTLARHVRNYVEAGLEYPRVVEVGVYAGDTSVHILKNFPNATVIGVDPFYNEEFAPDSVQNQMLAQVGMYTESRFEAFGDRARLLKMKSADALQLIPDQSMDIIFVDGDHRYEHAKYDIAAWEKKVKMGGVIAGHDFEPNWMGVVMALCELRPNRQLYVGMDAVWWWYVGVEDE
eukprot:GDKI01038638.1.p1 GENE.GDKI01038638.1~~GDKI01038638.1.p1  ORF type:complete len:415 (-),score=80.47 GDKI01038638.1:44-1240(-)